ncbi:MAG: LD-carboxypeptidase [Acidobacteria bacterium]|nr:LD-carboxypeptidase [Acidobacteriota bacterium]
MKNQTIQPPAIKKGDTIAVIAPASPIDGREGLERGISVLEAMGFHVRFDERIFESFRYLAGEDSARAEELMSTFEDPSIQAIIALRGGYGCSRLIPLIAEKRLRRHSKIFMGFSDLTTLFLYFKRRFGWITIHGPMAVSPSLGDLSPNQAEHLFSLLTDPGYCPELHFTQCESWIPGVAEGELVGGCLSIIAASIGTPYEIKADGRILFLEDQGEPPYRLDRMLTHLHLAGKLQSLAGVLLGSFLDCESAQGNYHSSDVLRDILAKLHVPIMANFPAGHGIENWAIPLGVRVRMDSNAGTITLLEPAVRMRD